jgi:hypothetical protein
LRERKISKSGNPTSSKRGGRRAFLKRTLSSTTRVDAYPFSLPRNPNFEGPFRDTTPLKNLRKNSCCIPRSLLRQMKAMQGGKASLHKPVGNEKGGMPSRPWASGTCASVDAVCNEKSPTINKNFYYRPLFSRCGAPAPSRGRTIPGFRSLRARFRCGTCRRKKSLPPRWGKARMGVIFPQKPALVFHRQPLKRNKPF